MCKDPTQCRGHLSANSVIVTTDPNMRFVVADKGTDDKFEIDVAKVFTSAESVLLKKHQDYGPTNISRSPGGPLNGLRVRMWDKLARINNLIDSGAEPENESLRDSFLDLMNYAAIAQVVLDGNWPEQ